MYIRISRSVRFDATGGKVNKIPRRVGSDGTTRPRGCGGGDACRPPRPAVNGIRENWKIRVATGCKWLLTRLRGTNDAYYLFAWVFTDNYYRSSDVVAELFLDSPTPPPTPHRPAVPRRTTDAGDVTHPICAFKERVYFTWILDVLFIFFVSGTRRVPIERRVARKEKKTTTQSPPVRIYRAFVEKISLGRHTQFTTPFFKHNGFHDGGRIRASRPTRAEAEANTAFYGAPKTVNVSSRTKR